MKKDHLLLSYFLFFAFPFCLEAQEDHNWSFEQVKDQKPINWGEFGSDAYTVAIDTEYKTSGKHSASIEYTGTSTDFKALSYTVPADYGGQKVKLTGYLKTENVTEGWAGLWLRVDPGVSFDNMQNRGVLGTTDWQKYEIELDLKPEQATQIVFGGLIAGKGKMWIDDLDLTIDGKPLDQAPAKAKLPAEEDVAFKDGSNIEIPALTDDLVENLTILGKVWGFLKYHHPEVGKGNYNWDFELFRMLPAYLNVGSKEERDANLLGWIETYGEVPVCENCKEPASDAFLKPDHSWMEQLDLSADLKTKLEYIKNNRHQGNHFYIGMYPYVGNPEFKHELPYDHMPYPDDGFRLLALYKYWNAIHYFFPYKHLIDKEWADVLEEYIRPFVEATTELEYELAAVQIIGDIKDTHANLWRGRDKIQEMRGANYPPVHVRFIEDQLVVTDYYNPELKEQVGLELGDVITAINGKAVSTLVKELHDFYPASNQPTRLRDISADLLRSNDKEIDIKVKNKKGEASRKLTLYPREELNIYRWYRRDEGAKSFKMLTDDIGYVTLKNIKEEDITKIKETFLDTRGIIIDIRNYPSTFVPFKLGGFFIQDSTAFVNFTGGNVDCPGEFSFRSSPNIIPPQEQTYKGKLVVLINELSQSQAEYTAMAFRAGDNTTIIGSTTAGADGNVSAIHLPGGMRTMISGIGVYYPDGTETQRVGIVPDIEVKPTIKGIKDGKDELLDKAIEVINKG